MNNRRSHSTKPTARQAKGRNTFVTGRTWERRPKQARRSSVGQQNARLPFAPPENWYEPSDRMRAAMRNYKIIVQPAGEGYRHVVSPDQVRARLSHVPAAFLRQLEVIQLSGMTRKKASFPCYGMQWGNALYLYPLEETLVEQFDCPPRPSLYNEARMYGGRWEEPFPGNWTLTWSPEAAQDFYLNNILIHELGHLVDDRNSTYVDRERYAEWFAIHYGYRRSGGKASRGYYGEVRRRHHGK